MAKELTIELKSETQDAETSMKIVRKRPRKFRSFELEAEGYTADNPLSRLKRYKGALMAVQSPSYCLKRGFGNLQSRNGSVRSQTRSRLFRLLRQLLRRHNWSEASGVLSLLLKANVKDNSIAGNRVKYTAILELLSVVNPDQNLSSKKIQIVYDLWMKKLGSPKYLPEKDRLTVHLEFILTCLQRGDVKDAYQAALVLMQEHSFDGDPAANLAVGLAFCQRWYSDIPKELQLSVLDSSGTYMQSEIPIGAIDMPIEYSKGDNAHEDGSKSAIPCYSEVSVANYKVEEDDGNQHKKSMDIEVKVKKETSYTSYEPPDSCKKLVEVIGISGSSSFHSYSGDLPRASIFHTQGLPPWLLPMKLPSSHENLEDAVDIHRKLIDNNYTRAVKHLHVALHSTPPTIEALHPLIQMLIVGDEVHAALNELETLFHSSDTLLQLRLQASLLEHFDSDNYVKLCTCFEDILKKDPTCSGSLSRLVIMHQRGEYDTPSLVEMIALHLDASYGTCDTWKELASCLLKLSECNEDRVSACKSDSDAYSHGCLVDSVRILELFTSGESRKSWRLRARWWLKRHFHDKILMSDIASGDLKVLAYKAATASHIYGRQFKYVVRATEYLKMKNDVELSSFLQTHLSGRS